MNRFPEMSPDRLKARGLPAMFMAILLMLAPGPTDAAGPAGGEAQKIRITADRLVADTKTGNAEFSGHVRAAQGTTIITSDRLKVLYDRDNEAAPAGEGDAAIKEIISTGNVVIHFDDKTATTDKAVYRARSGIFTLTGQGTRVTSGDNAITGEKITVDRKNDRVTVEGGREERVNAVIFTGRGGLSPPPPTPLSGAGEKTGE